MNQKKPNKSEHGATLVEATIALPFLLCLAVVCFDLLLISYHHLASHYVAQRVMREVKVSGNATLGSDPIAIENRILSLSNSLRVPIEKSGISFCPVALFPCASNLTAGPKELLILRVSIPAQGFMLGPIARTVSKENLLIESTAMAKMEPSSAPN